MTTTVTTTAPTASAAAVLDLLERSRRSLLEACQSRQVVERHQAARLGALRAAAALVAARTTHGGTTGPRSLWELLPVVAPELAEWAQFFELATVHPAGPGAPGAREADDLLRQAETFLDLVRRTLGLPGATHHADLLLPTSAAP
ncbi:MAG TPA: SAV_6107 family HEPN domain-containing protein [Pedococcus sp.]